MRRLVGSAFAAVLGLALLGAPATAPGVTQVSLTVGNPALFYNTGHWYVDGRVYNPNTSHVTDAYVHFTFKNASNVVLGTVNVPVACHVIENGDWKPFMREVVPPAGTGGISAQAYGTPTSAAAHVVSAMGDVTVMDLTTARVWNGQKLNGPTQLGSVIVAGEEWIQPPQWYGAVVDTYDIANVIQPDALDGIAAWEFKPTVGTHFLNYLDYEWVTLSYTHVWRFYNKRTGTHFYTSDPAEKDSVVANLGWLYDLEGEAYTVNSGSPSNMRPLYRFYNKRTGTHFYTMDEAEKANVEANLAAIYAYDGPAYNVSSFPFFSRPVYRFYNTRAGVHFYTATTAERDSVIANLGHIYTYEGPAFYLAY